MLILSADEVRQALPMRQAIEAMREAFSAWSAGRATAPQRIHLANEQSRGVSLFMPALVMHEAPERQALAVKAVSLFEGNQARGWERIQAAVLVLAPDSGRPLALLEGSSLTALRTAAASGLATEILARSESRKLAVFGAGPQARAHIEAVCAVRPIGQVSVYSKTPAKAARLIEALSRAETGGARLTIAASAQEALRGAEIVCAATTSREPIFADADLPAGSHLNAVGSYTPEAREIPPETVKRAGVYVDSRSAAWQEAGDLIQPLRAGQITPEHVRGELGEVLLGLVGGRNSAGEITLFKSVGMAVQDAVAARYALENARRLGLGVEAPW